MSPLQHDDRAASTALRLQEWLRADAAARTRQQCFGLWSRDQVDAKSGLEIFRAVATGQLPAPPILQTLDIQIVEVDEGCIVIQARPQAGHFNPLGSAHGGWIATLLDTAAGCAVHTTLAAGRSCATSNLNIHYVKAIGADVQVVRAIGRIVHRGRSMGTSEAHVVGPDGSLYAHATSSVVAFDPRRKVQQTQENA